MVSAGDNITALDFARVATMTPRTADSSATSGTTELSVDSVSASVVSGRTYKIVWNTRAKGDTTGDRFYTRVRLTSVTGTILQYAQVWINSTTAGWPGRVEVHWTAPSTGTQVFVGTLQRGAGTGTAVSDAGSTAPAEMYVDYISG